MYQCNSVERLMSSTMAHVGDIHQEAREHFDLKDDVRSRKNDRGVKI